MQRDNFRHLPLLGVERDNRGVIRNVTDRLLEAEGLRRRDVIGRPLVEVWPHGSQWLELDREALRRRRPLVRIEPSAHARWFRSTRVPTGKRVLWYGEDVTEIVKARAVLGLVSALADPSRRPLNLGGKESEFAAMVLAGYPAWNIADGLLISQDEAIAALWRASGT